MGRDQEQSHRAVDAGEMQHHLEGARLRPLHVLENHDQGAVPGQPAQQAGHGLEEQVALGVGIGHRLGDDREALGERRQQPHQPRTVVADAGAQLVEGQRGHRMAQRLHDGPVRRRGVAVAAAGQQVGPLAMGLETEVHGQRRLPDARLSADEDHTRTPGARLAERVEEAAGLGAPAHEDGVAVPRRERWWREVGGRPAPDLGGRRVAALRRWARGGDDAELVGEQAAQPLVGLQCTHPVAGPGQDVDELPVPRLVARLQRNHLLRQRDRPGGVAEGQRRLHAGVQGTDEEAAATLAEPLRPGAVVAGEKRLAAQRGGAMRVHRRGARVAPGQARLGRLHLGLRLLGVDHRVRTRLQPVAAEDTGQHRPPRGQAAENRAQPADDDTELALPRLGRFARPERAGELVAGHRAPPMDGEIREHEARLPPREGASLDRRAIHLETQLTAELDAAAHARVGVGWVLPHRVRVTTLHCIGFGRSWRPVHPGSNGREPYERKRFANLAGRLAGVTNRDTWIRSWVRLRATQLHSQECSPCRTSPPLPTGGPPPPGARRRSAAFRAGRRPPVAR